MNYAPDVMAASGGCLHRPENILQSWINDYAPDVMAAANSYL